MSNAPFELHPKLQEDCNYIGRFELCHLLLMNESRYPWFILVPDRPEVNEIFQLDSDDQMRLIRESSALAAALMDAFAGEKLNIATIGNLVPQLHIHHVVRYRSDAAWPGPVWGRFQPNSYSSDSLGSVLDTFHRCQPAGLILR